MAIDRLPPINLVPLITQRFDVSQASPLAPDLVRALVPLGPYMAPAPDAGAGGAHTSGTGFGGLPAAPGPDATPRDSSAMQANQVFFSRQLVWQAPNPGTLAASWRVMVKTYGEQYAALQEQARGQHVPGMVLMAELNPTALREGPRPPLAIDGEAWRFAVYGWGGQRLMLRVLASERDDEEPQQQHQRRRGKAALRLELMLANWGRVLVQMEPAAGGVVLELAAAEPAALQHLRRLLPELAKAIGRSGLRVVRCRLNRELQSARIHTHYSMQGAAASLTLPVFRAMAEVALLLSQPAERDNNLLAGMDAEREVEATPEPEPVHAPEPAEVPPQQLLLLQQDAPALQPDLAPDPELEAQYQYQFELELEPAPERRA